MSTTTSIVTVMDGVTHAAISGAQVFANGVGRGTTDNNGKIALVLSGDTYNLSVKATGYVTFTTNGVLTAQSFTVSMESTTTPSTVSFTLTIQPEAAATGVPIVFDNAGSPINANYNPGGVVVDGLTPGPQTISGTVTGYDSFSQTFDVSQVQSGTILLKNSADTGGILSSVQFPAQDPDTSGLLPALTPENLPEFIAPNTGQGTYFTMTQARMYIGGLFIDELNNLQFALQDNKIPVYGYASRFYDDIAQGKSLVQGQFAINFISEGYLVGTLNEYDRQVTATSELGNDVTAQQQSRLTDLVNKLQNPDPAWTPAMISSAKREINNLAASLGPTALSAAQAGIGRIRQQQDNSILGLPGGDYPNAVYSDVAFDIVIQYDGAGRSITRRLEDCRLISNESIMDHSGTPILDSYGFIAHRLR